MANHINDFEKILLAMPTIAKRYKKVNISVPPNKGNRKENKTNRICSEFRLLLNLLQISMKNHFGDMIHK